MKTTGKAATLLPLIMALAACYALTPRPTETPVPTATSLPNLVATVQPTIVATETPVPPTEVSSAAVLPTPSGEPIADWQGIPIMPNALAGEGDNGRYSFTVKAPLDEIQNYYEQELSKLGWNILGSGQGTTGGILMMFTKGQSVMSVSIIPQPEGVVYVMLVK